MKNFRGAVLPRIGHDRPEIAAMLSRMSANAAASPSSGIFSAIAGLANKGAPAAASVKPSFADKLSDVFSNLGAPTGNDGAAAGNAEAEHRRRLWAARNGRDISLL